MFAFLRGTVARKGLQYVELDVQGVGYEVWTPDSVLRKLVAGQDATLLTYCHIREDAFQIFGFLREDEKALFKTLLGVSGVGPKVALALLSALTPQAFARALTENDVTALTKADGVGKKLGQRIVLEMKAKFGQDTELGALLGEGGAAEPDPDSDDVVAALCALGCTLMEARRAAAKARKELGPEATAEALVKAALRPMAKV